MQLATATATANVTATATVTVTVTVSGNCRWADADVDSWTVADPAGDEKMLVNLYANSWIRREKITSMTMSSIAEFKLKFTILRANDQKLDCRVASFEC